MTTEGPSELYRLTADLILVLHALFVAFVVCGFTLVWVGFWRSWAWVRDPVFRIAHIVAIGVVVLQAWAGVLCPLTVWENALRARAGETGYGDSFIRYWLHELLFYDAPPWVFTAGYSLFAMLVILTWIVVRPRPLRDPDSRQV